MPKKESVPGTETTSQPVSWRLPRRKHSVPLARTALRTRLNAWGLGEDTAATAELLLSELVTNAVRHAGNPPGRQVGIQVCLSPTGLRLEVSDACDTHPPTSAEPPPSDAESGRGLLLVAALADDWGVTPRPYGIGKTVWASLTTASGNGHRARGG